MLPLLVGALLLWPGPASAATITVDTATDAPGTQCTLRDAIKAANTNLASNGCVTPGSGTDTIQFQLPNPSTITLESALDQITGDVSIQGPGASQLTVSGNSLYRVFNIASGKTVSISGLAAAGGSVVATGCSSASEAGGGILNFGTLTLDRMVVSGNHATATDNSGGSTCVFGAGIYNGGTLTLNKSTVSGNRASATETVADHDADAEAAGIYNRTAGTLRIDQSTVSDNTAHAYVSGGAVAHAQGAGILNVGSATLTNTTVTNNGEITPGGQGGGIYSEDSLTLRNDTISQNIASSQAGDGGNLYNASSAADMTVKNTIVAEPLTSGNCGGTPPTSLGNNLGFDTFGDTYPCFAAGNGNVFDDPMLGPLQDNGGPTQTEAIGPGSAALDAGSDCEATDQRGLSRSGTAGPCDIGAFELGAASSADTTAPNTTITSGPADGSRTKDSTPTLNFSATEPGSTFQCKLDEGSFNACTSPKTLAVLSDGSHTFSVEASDPTGNTDASPASRNFTVDTIGPNSKISKHPKKKTSKRKAKFKFKALSSDAAGFDCKLDFKKFKKCKSPLKIKVKPGRHTFQVRAIDDLGNKGRPVKFRWKVKR
ncbi:MAG: CSLREA domain-containing protein [Thermoleophilia bacterium]|nr:CSLREA domain-containing protein [Thermoleophilia bacterium]